MHHGTPSARAGLQWKLGGPTPTQEARLQLQTQGDFSSTTTAPPRYVMSVQTYLARSIPRVLTALGLQNITELLARTLRTKYRCIQRTSMLSVTGGSFADNVDASEQQEAMADGLSETFDRANGGINDQNLRQIMQSYVWEFHIQTGRARYRAPTWSERRRCRHQPTQQCEQKSRSVNSVGRDVNSHVDADNDDDADDDDDHVEDDEAQFAGGDDRPMWQRVELNDLPTAIRCWRIPPDSICCPPIPRVSIQDAPTECVQDLLRDIDHVLQQQRENR